MYYTELTRSQLADNFERVADDFYDLIRDNDLEETEVDMGEGWDRRKPERNLCHTPACHGGWAAIMYGLKSSPHSRDFYQLGADRLAEKLGFEGECHLQLWADGYPEYWGNDIGGLLFSSSMAFSKPEQEVLFLKEIPDWYMEVAKRLREGA